VNKKRHIGNDFVNVIFNRSNLPFNFDTFPSQFNYVNIVITPKPASPLSKRNHSTEQQIQRFRTDTTKSKLSPVQISFHLPAAETKIISAKGLPTFVRLLALNASVFSLVWSNREDGGEHVFVAHRLREIVKLRERYAGLAHGTGSGKAGGKRGVMSRLRRAGS
jgi:hypothetical protein